MNGRHRHRVPADHADLPAAAAVSRRRAWRRGTRRVPVARLGHQAGIVVLRRPPNRIAFDRTPRDPRIRGQDRALGDRGAEPGVRGARRAPRTPASSLRRASRSGARAARPCPPTRRPAVGAATLVKTELPRARVRIAFGLVFQSVPGATPNRPYSGLSAEPAVGAEPHPGDVVAQGLDLPAREWWVRASRGWSCHRPTGTPPRGSGPGPAEHLRISIASASQPSSRPITLAIRSE